MDCLSTTGPLVRDRRDPYLRSPLRPGRLLAAGTQFVFAGLKAWLRRAASAAVLLAALAVPAEAGTVLERVLRYLSKASATDSLVVLANIAENNATLANGYRDLATGDRVVIGYDATGSPVVAEASEIGVLVTAEQAATLTSGLAPGLYPVGSRLYTLPPGAQLSLFEAAADGVRLEAARELLMTRIDGRVNTVLALSTVAPELLDLATVAISSEQIAQTISISEIRTTVLGAVNTGMTVTQVQITEIVGPIGAGLDAIAADVLRGASGSVRAAATASTHASSRALRAIDGTTLAVNVASNSSEVTGAIRTLIRDRSAEIAGQVTTVLGAVNSGTIHISN